MNNIPYLPSELNIRSLGVWVDRLLFPLCFQSSKADNLNEFLFATWRMKSSQNELYSNSKEFALMGANSFLYAMTLICILYGMHQ